MRQTGLFDSGGILHNTADTNVGGLPVQKPVSQKTVRFYPEFYSWLSVACDCLADGYTPNHVWWSEDPVAARSEKYNSKDNNMDFSGDFAADFVSQARVACCHSNQDRWALLYSILWRMHHGEPQLMELAGDNEIAIMHKYAKAVSRDAHKMKAFVRFRKIEGDPPRYVSWFEPQHFIVEYTAGFFKRRFANMCWSILTPVGCVHWDIKSGEIKSSDTKEGSIKPDKVKGELWFSDAVDKKMAPSSDQFEHAWRVYYKSIFNPARLKVNAMQSEMPKKYWKNLPEAREIPSLISSAESRNRQMIQQRKDTDTLHCGARPSHPNQIIRAQINSAQARESNLSPLQALKLKASLCSECPQGRAATQTVFGVGPEDASIMIIGEQPGDQEDLHGTPFVGPAGQLLSAALKRAGIDRNLCYLTNAVKHFGFVPRGKRRIHKRPEAGVVSACGQWLAQELLLVDPDIVIYLGATAASTAFGKQVRVQHDRGQLIIKDGRQHLITVHPSSILRLARGPLQQNAYLQFIGDLQLCARFVTENCRSEDIL